MTGIRIPFAISFAISLHSPLFLYILHPGEKRAEWPISGIPKEDIMNYAKEVEIKNTYVKLQIQYS